MARRQWTADEVRNLYRYAETVSQKVAAKRLGRTAKSVSGKARALGLRWRQGFWNYTTIAAEVGCSPSTARRLAQILCPDGVPQTSTGCASRVLLDYETAQRIVRVLRKTRRHRQHKIRAGKASGVARRACAKTS